MGKKYLNTKKGSIEQSILDVWQEAADMYSEGMNGRTKEYRSQKTEQPETQHGSGEHAYEVGTDRYAEYTQLVTPGQIREFLEEMPDEELDNILEDADEEILEGFVTIMSEENVDEGILSKAAGFLAKKAGSGIAKAAKRYGTTGGRAAGLKKKVAKKVQKKKDVASIAKSKKALKNLKNDMTENRNLTDTIKNLWIEAAAAAVDPKEREELDLAPEDTAKKMKRAKEPAPGVSEELDEIVAVAARAGGAIAKVGRKAGDIAGRLAVKAKKKIHKATADEFNFNESTGKEIAAKMMTDKSMKAFASKVAKMKVVSRDDLEKLLPDYVDGGAITKLFKEDTVNEGTWALPKTPKEKDALKKLLSKPLKAKDASKKLYDIIGDDQLADDVDDFAEKHPNDDVRAIVKSHMKRMGIKEGLDEGTKEEYQKFFQGALKKFKIKSPAELKSDEEKKKFFDYVDKNYTGEKDEEKIEEKIELAKEFKVSSMRHALEKVWSVAEGELPPALKKAIDAKKKDKEEDEDYHDDEKKENTMTGKKKAGVDVNPHQGSR